MEFLPLSRRRSAREMSPAVKSEEKRTFSQATYCPATIASRSVGTSCIVIVNYTITALAYLTSTYQGESDAFLS